MKKSLSKYIPGGVICLLILGLIFGYMGSVMGLTNMLNTLMKTAHDLLLNTVFYLMGMCVLTGALGKLLVEFGVVDLLQKLLKPVMKPLFNLPGVASLGAVLTFLSDNPAIISLSQDRHFARYFKKYQHVSLINFGTTFGMGLLVIIFMMGQGYFLEPFIGFIGAVFGCIITTRLMQYFVCKDHPNFKTENAISEAEIQAAEWEKENSKDPGEEGQGKDGIFLRTLNALLDGGKTGVEIGLAIIPGVLIISTLVMMLTFGGHAQEGGPDIYTGAAYEGTKLLPLLAGKISFVFNWLFGFSAPELVAFPITALGAVGAALGLIPEFASQGLVDGNAIAVCTAMGMCWSGFLSTHAASLDSLGYRSLVSRAYQSHFISGICAGIFTHWVYVGVIAIGTLFAPKTVWTAEGTAINCITGHEYKAQLTALDDNTYVIKDWFGEKGTDLKFKVNTKDSTVIITNAWDKNDKFYYVRIDQKAKTGEPSYASVCVKRTSGNQVPYSRFVGNKDRGHMYIFTYIYDSKGQALDGNYYEIKWGGDPGEIDKATWNNIQTVIDAKLDLMREKQEEMRRESNEQEMSKDPFKASAPGEVENPAKGDQ